MIEPGEFTPDFFLEALDPLHSEDMSKVLVILQANTEQVEQLALAVAVGGVEAEALIRLRRLAAADAPEVGHKSYGRLQDGHLMWADAVVVVLENAAPNFEELDPMLELLDEAERPGAIAGHCAAMAPIFQSPRRKDCRKGFCCGWVPHDDV